MSCNKYNIDLSVCSDITKDYRQDLSWGWKIIDMPVASEFTLTLFGRNRIPKKTYKIIPVDDTLVWAAPDIDFENSTMYYEMIPTTPSSTNWIRFYGKITNRK